MTWANKPRIYKIWEGMKQRCNNPNNPRYKYYGGNGIKICKEWNESSAVFIKWAMENGYSDELTIDRINPLDGYRPENCRFITISDQQRNRTNNRIINTPSGPMTLMDAVRNYGICKSTLRQRIDTGMSEESAIMKPIDAKKRNKRSVAQWNA
jgi:hypothetical protein